MESPVQEVHNIFNQTSGGIILPVQLLPFFEAANEVSIGSIVHKQENVNKSVSRALEP